MSDYKSGYFESCAEILKILINRKTDSRTDGKIQQLLLLFLVGEFYGLNTLNKILSSYGATGNDYSRLWRELTCRKLVGLLNDWLWGLFSKEFSKRVVQSGSTHSRQKLTIVIDGSIFKQWLTNEEFGKYFSKYYSGQYGSSVYGFNVLLCGMVIGEIFYPLHFQLRKKEEKDVEVASKILKRVHQKLDDLAVQESVCLPSLYLSVDSGFRSKELIAYCENSSIIYIGVPKVNHVVHQEGKRLKIKDLKAEFEKRESTNKAIDEASEIPFVWRVRVDYQAVGRQVTLLLFRLNGSKKVSVIFSPDLDIKAKTMRRHWFERTKIELLFRMIKNDFKIQQMTTRNRLGFMKKLALALVKSVFAQVFTQSVKKSNPSFQRLGFEGIRQKLIFYQIGKEWLDELIDTTFCKERTS